MGRADYAVERAQDHGLLAALPEEGPPHRPQDGQVEPRRARSRLGQRRVPRDPAAGSRGRRPARRALFHVQRGRRSVPRRPETRPQGAVHRRRRGAALPRQVRGAQSGNGAAAAAEPRRVLREAFAEVDAAAALLSQGHGQRLMRIAIDARKLRDFGIGTYIRNILIELSRLDRETDYVVLCRPDDVESGDVLGRNFRMVPETAPAYSIGEQFRIPLSLARERVQLVHEPHYVLPPHIKCRSVVTIHDCIHLMFPQYLPSRLAYVYAKGSMWTASKKADRILTVSEASKRDILRFFDVPPEKVVVAPNAIDERFLSPVDPEKSDLVRQRYQLDHP